jgi:carboxyl-terminal processing protease
MSKKLKLFVISIVLVFCLVLAFVGGCSFNLIKPATSSQSSSGLNYSLIKEGWSIIHNDYVDPSKLNDNTLTEGAIKGMVDSIKDPYSAYMTKDIASVNSSDFQGQFEGVGASVGVDENNRVIIVAPIAGSPADQAGIKAGDLLIAVDGKSMTGLTPTDAMVLIRGPKGSTVTLTVLHKDATTPVDISIVRATINLNSVSFEMKGDIAYIKITQFTERTDDELTPYLQTITQNGAKGIIIDLRDNPGGILDTVVSDVSHFVKINPVVSVVDRNGNKTSSSVKNVSPTIYDLPMVVLVNGNSASGSEVFSGALQDDGRALIAGTKTFGKGSVDTLASLSDGSAIYITIARWETPNGHLIEGKGIQPDQVLDFSTVDGIQWAIDYLHNK